MAFDPKLHAIDPVTGLIVHKDDGRVVGLVSPESLPPADYQEFPKYVYPHASHIVYEPRNGKLHVENFEYHLDRHNVVSVLVHDAEEEAKALADANYPHPGIHPVEDKDGVTMRYLDHYDVAGEVIQPDDIVKGPVWCPEPNIGD
jgi:hypothetical protein